MCIGIPTILAGYLLFTAQISSFYTEVQAYLLTIGRCIGASFATNLLAMEDET